MQNEKKLWTVWLLAALASIAMAAGAVYLLSHERERIIQSRQETERERLENLAADLLATIDKLRESIYSDLSTISDLPPNRQIEELRRREKEKPLVRNTFLFHKRKGLTYPKHNAPETPEQQRFLQRYSGLFEGRIPWREAAPADSQPKPPDTYQQKKLSIQSFIRRSKTSAFDQNLPNINKHLRFWHWENKIQQLLYISNGQQIVGAELEQAALDALIIPILPHEKQDRTFIMTGETPGPLYQSGNADIDNQPPDLQIAVDNYIPGRKLQLYLPEQATEGAAAFWIISLLLTACFLAVVLVGGFLLITSAHRHALEARQKTTFVSNVSHELKTPLTSIRMYAELLAGDNEPPPEKKNRWTNIIHTEAERLTRLVNNVLDFSRIERKRKTYNPTELNLSDTIRSATEPLAAPLKQAELDLFITIPEDLKIVTDPDVLTQVIVNLIDNAVKYAATGNCLKIKAYKKEARTIIDIEDNGPGIDPKLKEKLFEPFYRVDDSLTASTGGCGLGLSISRNMLHDLGGDLTLHQTSPDGACFRITL